MDTLYQIQRSKKIKLRSPIEMGWTVPLVLRTLNVLALRASYLVLAPTYSPLVLLVAGRGTAQPSDSVRGPRNE